MYQRGMGFFLNFNIYLRQTEKIPLSKKKKITEVKSSVKARIFSHILSVRHFILKPFSKGSLRDNL